MIETNPFAQGEIRSGNTLTASSNNEEMASAQAPVQEIQAEENTSEPMEEAQLPAIRGSQHHLHHGYA